MSARETLNRWVEAMQILCGKDDNPGPQRRAGYEETRQQMLNAAYAEVLREGARLLEDAACDADWTRTPDYCAGLRAGAELLLAAVGKATAEAATATSDFFEPGRSYTSTGPRDVWLRFVCEHVTRDPQTGVREAWGWLHRADGTRRMERAWESSYPQWTVEDAEAGDGRG
ncbi:hypothetical protein [Streptomyces caniscabiei]|uniref:Uncharacterized protein n=1 Tax=Streptomyces caniscabiei TaxID=2746961 RepID=A0A927L0Q1_9ACTN|nr:hypothetical protein [Streptomyces caniscabiei]MBD9723505.1 hypothetical protein [Streptomyces caniscabiei]MDX3721069.1 hypothetical protein [Streptomyces caniscabiei]WEO27076.1 hypothetical protein IHE65_30115 [Streptomyces caniscabiei]